MNLLSIPVLLPLAAGLLILAISEKTRWLRELLAIGVTAVCFLAALNALAPALLGQHYQLTLPWLGGGMDFSLKADSLSAFLLLAVSFFSLLVSFYAFSFPDKGKAKWFYFNVLLTQSFAAGAALADSLIALLFFWEGLLVFLYTFIVLSRDTAGSRATSMKAFLINAVTDLCLLLGVAITAYLAGTTSMSEISAEKLTLNGWGGLAYVLLLIGALSKAGAIPFHTWIPDAATDSSAPFMAYVPAAIDKLLGIYFLARISVDLFQLNGAMQLVLMTIGALTIIIAVMMAFVQRDYKRLLSYHAVSQTGYMILGIGTLNPVGIAGGLFHMINHASYKSCLFMTAGAVERQAGTGDLGKLGGLFRAMPVTAVCFMIAAAAISGIAPFNGFFSKELVYKGTLETGWTAFFIVAEIGSLLTLASFLKLGHSVFFDKRPEGLKDVSEAPFSMLLPMLVLAAVCVVFGFGAAIPVTYLIGPALDNLAVFPERALSGFHLDNLFFISVIVILGAVMNHLYGYSAAKGRASRSSDHIHHAPVLGWLYELAEKRFFDPYEQIMKRVPAFSALLYKTDRFFDWLIDGLPLAAAGKLGDLSRRFHGGSYPAYMVLMGLAMTLFVLFTANSGGIK